MDPMTEIREFIQKHISDRLDLTPERVRIIRRNRTLNDGDFQVPLACLIHTQRKRQLQQPTQLTVTQAQNEVTAASVSAETGKLVTEATLGIPDIERNLATSAWGITEQTPGGHKWIRIRQCTCGKDQNMYFCLSRKEVFEHVLKLPLEQLTPREDERTLNVLLNCADVHNVEKNQMTVDDLRALLMQEHIHNLLSCNGVPCQTIPSTYPEEWKEVCDTFGLTQGQEADNITTRDILHDFSKSPYRIIEKEHGLPPDASKLQHPADLPGNPRVFQEGSTMTLDLLQYVNDMKLPTGKDGFDRNIKQVTLPQRHMIRQLSVLEEYVVKQEKVPDVCLHLVSRPGSFQQQLIHILWQMAVRDRHALPKQMHIVRGSVCKRLSPDSKESPTVEDYFRLRKLQMERAFVLKYGERVQGPGWDDTITQLTTAAIRFELLTNTCNSSVKVDMTQPSDADDDEDSPRPTGEVGVGVFVMYNYARLATLLDNFGKAVQEGVYPPMPDTEEVDFQTLREEEEWGLLFNYILPYQTMVADAVQDLTSSSSLRPNIHTHKVCQFLHDFCRDLSSYYSRVHVLVENRRHLLPVMYARVCLLRAVGHVLRHALRLLGINPLSQL